MKTISRIAIAACVTLLSGVSACTNYSDTSDVMEDTTLNQDTAFRTDTFMPTGDTDPRYQASPGNPREDSIRVKKETP